MLPFTPCRHEDFDVYLDRFENTRGFGCSAHNKKAFGKYFADRLTPYLYTGRRYSDFTSQYFNRNRYYSPALGRFISKDPIGFNGGNNLYRYADNNPALYTDPFGLIWVFAGWTQYLESNVDVNRDPTYRYLPRFEIMRVDYWQYIEHWIPEPPCFEQKKPQLGRAPRFQSFTPIGIRPFMGSTNYYSDKVPEKALYFKTDPVSSFRELPAPPPHN